MGLQLTIFIIFSFPCKFELSNLIGFLIEYMSIFLPNMVIVLSKLWPESWKQTDGRTVAIIIPPPNFVCGGGNNTHLQYNKYNLQAFCNIFLNKKLQRKIYFKYRFLEI